MNWFKDTIKIATRGKGLYSFTHEVTGRIANWGIKEGMCYLYIPHTSASLTISENYDPTAKEDLNIFMDKLVPENLPWYRHTLEGPDDSPSHIRALITDTSLAIPIDNDQLNLGRWQGIYLFEHRVRGQERMVILRCLGVQINTD